MSTKPWAIHSRLNRRPQRNTRRRPGRIEILLDPLSPFTFEGCKVRRVAPSGSLRDHVRHELNTVDRRRW